MGDCVFCRIVNGEMPSNKIWENDEFVAILDIFPNTEGMAILLTKQHYPSYVFRMENDVYCRFMEAGRTVALLLDKALKTKRTAMVMEGTGVNHAHLKFYPLHGLKEEFEEMWSAERIFFETYHGYISTQLGPRMPDGQLMALARHIREQGGQ